MQVGQGLDWYLYIRVFLNHSTGMSTVSQNIDMALILLSFSWLSPSKSS